jgi:hypothetical protein
MWADRCAKEDQTIGGGKKRRKSKRKKEKKTNWMVPVQNPKP